MLSSPAPGSFSPPSSFSSPPAPPSASAGGLAHKLLSGGASSDGKPHVIRHALAVSLDGKPAGWMASLSDLGFTSARILSDSLELELVQSNDLFGKAHDFIRLTLSKKELVIAYTVLPAQNPARRKLEAARLALLALGATRSLSSPPALLSFMAECLDGAIANLSLCDEPLLSKNAQLDERVRELGKALKGMAAGRESDARKMLADAQAIGSLQSRLDALLSMSDRAVDEEVMEWLRSHDGVVSVRELARHLAVPPSRVEAGLDRLCKQGLIAKVEK